MCGQHKPEDKEELRRLNNNGLHPTQLHNNCSGKHLGFLAVSKYLQGGLYTKRNYVDKYWDKIPVLLKGESELLWPFDKNDISNFLNL